jgi:hypothetical protein
MNIRIIINSLIIIFILHIIILNINQTYIFGKKKNIENFEDKNSDNTLNFLTNDNSDSNDEFKKKMLKYTQVEYEKPKENKFEKENLNHVEASNTYLNDNNVPNFESNVADVKKFYNINYDNLDEKSLTTSLSNLKNFESLDQKQNKNKENISVNPISNETPNINPYGRDSTVLPDNWKYADELPMNGGVMNGIHGFDTLESQFAIYNPNKLNLQSVKNDNFDNIPHDDLRKPIVYEN